MTLVGYDAFEDRLVCFKLGGDILVSLQRTLNTHNPPATKKTAGRVVDVDEVGFIHVGIVPFACHELLPHTVDLLIKVNHAVEESGADSINRLTRNKLLESWHYRSTRLSGGRLLRAGILLSGMPK